MSSIEDRIFDMYYEENIGSETENKHCGLCKKHHPDLAGPISFFHIGSNFENDKYKIIFVGKNSWYNKIGYESERVEGTSIADATETGRDSLIGAWNEKSKYWDYIREIIKKLYINIKEEEERIENIAITNIIKCNTTGEKNIYDDKTPKDVIENCIASRIFEKEIKIIKPKHIIFLTGNKYDKYIEEFNFGCEPRILSNNSINNGKILNWRRNLYDKGDLKYSILRTSHPQGKKKRLS